MARGAITLNRVGWRIRWTWWREVNDGRGWFAPMESGLALTRWGAIRAARADARQFGWKPEMLPLVDRVPTLS